MSFSEQGFIDYLFVEMLKSWAKLNLNVKKKSGRAPDFIS